MLVHRRIGHELRRIEVRDGVAELHSALFAGGRRDDFLQLDDRARPS